MKKLILLFALGIFTLSSNAQEIISNGETIGTSWWPAGSAGAVDTWDNPLKDAVNGTDKAMTVWINNTDANYTGGGMGGLNVDVALYNTISVMIYKQIAGKVRLELQDGTSNYFVEANYTTPNAWQKLEFAIPSAMGNITTLLVAPHFEDYTANPIPDGEAHRMWWDEVVAFEKTTTSVKNFDDNADRNIVKTEIYSITGSLLKTYDSKIVSFHGLFAKGIYIVKETDDKNVSISRKINIL